MKKLFSLILMSVMICLSSCEKMLEEDVKNQISSSYYDTEQGVNEGINAAYSLLRSFYGQQSAGYMTVFGTDEFTNTLALGYNLYNFDINPRSSVVKDVWNLCYQAINTCNAVLDRLPNIPMDATLRKTRTAEAKFLRAYYYFLLVQTYGPVHINVTEVKSTTRVAKRSPINEVYDLIISDMTDATSNLPATTPNFGRATLPAAKHMLAKIYLTRGQSTAKQTSDFAMAAQLAKDVIGPVGQTYPKLLPDFASVFVQGAGEKSDEVIFSVQYSIDVNNWGNKAHMYFNSSYEGQMGMVRDIPNGRAFAHYRPTDFLMNLYNKTYDSRWDKSFRTAWLSNKPGTYTKTTDPLKNRVYTFALNDTAFVLKDREVTLAERQAAKYVIYTPSEQAVNLNLFPVCSKFYDALRTTVNEQNGNRDFIVCRLAETYLIAAEALLLDGKTGEAVFYINQVRRRAAKTGTTAAITEANKTAMEIGASQVTIDFILDERARELAGEYMRWFDLVRTGKLIGRVKLYNTLAAPNIMPYHVLRPIPQDQIDATDGGAAAFPQNAGYN